MHAFGEGPWRFCIALGIMLFALPSCVFAAELGFSPGTGSFAVGAEFSVKIVVIPGTDSVNAADGSISFDKDVLSVASISKDGSAFSLWTADPTFSNSAGTITFSGGTPTAFTSEGTVLTVKFKGKKAGTGAVLVTKGSILAADGKGTDVYKKGTDASFTITEAAAAPAPETPAPSEEEVGANNGGPITPTINSSTHPKEDQWYATSTIEFSWKPTSDVVTVRTLVSDREDTKPTKSQDVKVTSQRQEGVADGVWWVYVQYQNDIGWGEVAKRAFRVDTTPPNDFDVALIEGEVPKFSFQTEDALSGMEKYEILFGETVAAGVKPSDIVEGQYPVPPQAGGPQKVTIKAIDKAGNVRAVTKDFTLPEVLKAKGKGEEEEAKESIWSIPLILCILFAMIIGAVVAWNIYIRKMESEKKLKFLQEIARARDKNDKIFAAMREEFEELVNNLDEKPQLTPAERDFLENMKEALEISEELVDSGMEDLKKMIRG